MRRSLLTPSQVQRRKSPLCSRSLTNNNALRRQPLSYQQLIHFLQQETNLLAADEQFLDLTMPLDPGGTFSQVSLYALLSVSRARLQLFSVSWPSPSSGPEAIPGVCRDLESPAPYCHTHILKHHKEQLLPGACAPAAVWIVDTIIPPQVS